MAFKIQFYTEAGEPASYRGPFSTREAAQAAVGEALDDLPNISPYKKYGASVEEYEDSKPESENV